MNEDLQPFLELPGVRGACLHRGAQVAVAMFPEAEGVAGAQALAGAITETFTAYCQIGRPVTQGFFAFPENSVLTVTALPKSAPLGGAENPRPLSEAFLTFLLENREAVPGLISPARAYLTRLARADAELWLRFREDLLRIIGRVLNRAQCHNVMAKILMQEQVPAGGGVGPDRFIQVGRAMIREIPNQAKHEALFSELDAAVARLTGA